MVQGRDGWRYCPFYCEENIWHLVGEERVVGGAAAAHVVFVSNEARACAFWRQRAAPSPEVPVVWDYHVVLAVRRGAGSRVEVWDLDTTLGLPVAFDEYVQATFRTIPGVVWNLGPRFRLIEASRYREAFSSDRSHMRDASGDLQHPAPWWPPITRQEDLPGSKFLRWAEMADGDEDVMGLDGLRVALAKKRS